MQEAVEGAQSARVEGRAVAALLDWWKLAGVDALAGDAPRAWLSAAPDLPVAIEPAIAEPSATQGRPEPRSAAVRPAADTVDWDSFTSLEALLAAVRADNPRAPIADGAADSGLMLLGEAPSAEDLRSGRPFTGPAGQLLDRMLAAIGRDRRSAYVSLLCPRRRVPGPPPPDAIGADLALTRAHIRLAAPRLVLLLGANPVQALTGVDDPISRVRGTWLNLDAGAGTVPALATFNPAYLLRRPEEKAKAWDDLLALRRRLLQ